MDGGKRLACKNAFLHAVFELCLEEQFLQARAVMARLQPMESLV